MNKFAGNISVALLLAVYLAAAAGFKLHECSSDHSVELLSVLADDACEQVHHHDCDCGEHCGHNHHHSQQTQSEEPDGLQLRESDCCHSSVHALFSEQITASDGAQDGLCVLSQNIWQPEYKAVSVASGRVAPCYSTAIRPSGRTMLVLYSVARA